MLKTVSSHESKTLTTSQVTTISIAPFGKIHSMVLRFATGASADTTVAAIKSEISNIRVTLNGRDVVNCSPTKLFDIYAMLGQNVNDAAGIASVMELNLGRLIFTDPALREVFGWGTNNVQSIQVSITAGTLSTIASARVHTSRTPVVEDLGAFCSVINYPVSFNSTGDHSMDTLPRSPDASYLALLIDSGASGTITDSELKLGNTALREKMPRTVNGVLLSNDRLSQGAGYFAHTFCDGSVESRLALAGITDLRSIQSFSVAPGAAGYNITAIAAVNVPALR